MKGKAIITSNKNKHYKVLATVIVAGETAFVGRQIVFLEDGAIEEVDAEETHNVLVSQVKNYQPDNKAEALLDDLDKMLKYLLQEQGVVFEDSNIFAADPKSDLEQPEFSLRETAYSRVVTSSNYELTNLKRIIKPIIDIGEETAEALLDKTITIMEWMGIAYQGSPLISSLRQLDYAIPELKLVKESPAARLSLNEWVKEELNLPISQKAIEETIEESLDLILAAWSFIQGIQSRFFKK